LIGIAAMIVWAFVAPSVLALMAGGLVTAVARTVLSHLCLPGHRDRIGWDREAGGKLIRFGRWILLSTAFTFLAGQADRLILGKMLPLDMFGVFTVATMLSGVPGVLIERLAGSIYFPLFSRTLARGEDLATEFRRAREPVLIFGAWAVTGLVAGGPTIVRLLYDERYQDAGWILPILAIGSWFLILAAVNGAALLASGHSKLHASTSVVKVIAMVALIPLGYVLGGFQGAVVANAVSEVFRYWTSVVAVRRVGVACWRRDLGLTAFLLTSGLLVERAAALATGTPVVLRAIFVALVVTLAWLPFGWRYIRPVFVRGAAARVAE
jgi:O-antigen/teichoic acid export membrane protein